MAKKKQSESIKTLEKKAKELTEKLIDLVGVKADSEVIISEDLIQVNIEGEDLGLLIGYRGENVESLQLLLGLIINRKLDLEDWRPVLVDIGGWRKQREESLRALVEKEVGQLKEDGESIDLPPMPPTQRRSVHIIVSELEGLTSESEGEGSERHVVIKKQLHE